jgi:hypothetical protein
VGRRDTADLFGLVDDLNQRGEAAGAEEDAAGQVDREVEARRRPRLREAGAEREQRAADDERGRGDRVDEPEAYGETKVAGSGPIR